MSERYPIDFRKPGLLHERWGYLGDSLLVAVCEGGYTATELAKAMARRASPEQAYVVTDCATGKQTFWTKESVQIADAKAALA